MDKDKNYLITSYKTCDLDGFSCSLAFNEYLSNLGFDSIVKFYGNQTLEVKIVCDKFNLDYDLEKKSDFENRRVILLDHSSPSHISNFIDISKVTLVIDHRKIHNVHLFKNTVFQIELVASCATLITEKFMKKNMKISTNIANILYLTIMSNSIKLKAGITTARDRLAVTYLRIFMDVDESFIDILFKKKSKILDIKTCLANDFAIFEKYDLCVAQLEIYNVDLFLKKNIGEILKFILIYKKNNNLKYAFLTLIDLKLGKNYLVCDDLNMQSILEKTFKNKFKNNILAQDKIYFRKEIIPKLCENLN
jgi:inorganic pyrophosphatase/exopolyphosphatase